MYLLFPLFSRFTTFFYVVAPVVTASDPAALVDVLLTRFLLVAADVRPPFLLPFFPAAVFLDLVFAVPFDFALAISLLLFLSCHYFIRSYDEIYLIGYLFISYIKSLYYIIITLL
jgi:hypothetical protein